MLSTLNSEFIALLEDQTWLDRDQVMAHAKCMIVPVDL